MKMDMSAKPTGEGIESTNEGNYSQEQLEEMLENFLEAKKIEADPKLFMLVKDYAMSRNKMVEELFKQPSKSGPVKSLKDIKKKYDDVVEIENSGETGEE